MTGRRLLAVVLVMVATVATGCGSDGSVGKETFVADADKVCAEGNKALAVFDKRIREAQQGADPAKVFADLASVTRAAAEASEPFLTRLDALKPPNDDRDKLKAWLADQRRQQSLLDELADAFEQQDDATIATASQQIDTLNEKSNAFAKMYGMAQCAKGAG